MELTEGSFWAGNGRRWKLGIEGRSSGMTAMAGDGLSSISAGFGHGRARGWSEWVDGEAAQLGVRRIEAGWRGLAGGMTNDGRRDELGFARSAHGARKGNGELEASRARATIRAVLGQRGSSGWTTRGVARRRSVAGMGAGVHSAEQLLCSLV